MTRRTRCSAAVGLLFGVLVLGTGTPSRGSTGDVEIGDFGFYPDGLRVHPGDQVVWRNLGSTMHTVTSSDSGPAHFDSGAIATGQEFVHTFDEMGTFAYECKFHASMTATVSVGEDTTTSSTSTTSSTTTTTMAPTTTTTTTTSAPEPTTSTSAPAETTTTTVAATTTSAPSSTSTTVRPTSTTAPPGTSPTTARSRARRAGSTDQGPASPDLAGASVDTSTTTSPPPPGFAGPIQPEPTGPAGAASPPDTQGVDGTGEMQASGRRGAGVTLSGLPLYLLWGLIVASAVWMLWPPKSKPRPTPPTIR